VAHRNYYGTVIFRKVRQWCGGKAFSNRTYTTTSSLLGGVGVSAAPRIAIGKCQIVPKGVTMRKHTTVA
jgi:hypothetical protein